MITRQQVSQALLWVQDYLINNHQHINEATKTVLRKQENLKVYYTRAIKRLNLSDIEYFELYDGHWAETDGVKIWLNRCKDFSMHNLKMTILHEILHGIVQQNGKELSEYTEHRMMYVLNPQLV
jgi:hypothetical protein